MLLSRPVGLDVASYQGSINWTSVKNAGKSFAFIRAATGRTAVDSTFHTNATNALAAGLYIGYYYYAYYDDAGHTPTGDADAYWNTIYNPSGTHYIAADGKHLNPVIDVEQGTTTSNGEPLSRWVYEFCERLKSDAAAVGFNITPMVYCSQSQAASNVSPSTGYFDPTGQYFPGEFRPLWVAQWPNTIPDPQTTDAAGSGVWQTWGFWQYADNGTVSGITGAVDLDVLHGSSTEFADYAITSTGTSAGRWPIGTWVQATTSLKAWDSSTSNSDSPWSDTYQTVGSGTAGKILAGPVYGSSFWRWDIQYNGGITGWSAEYQNGLSSGSVDYLITATPTAATTGNVTGTINSLPANFTWTAGNNVASYDVYLDGTKKATVTTNSWAHGAIADGTHNWYVVSNNADLSATSATFNFTLDTVAPAAAYGGQTPTNNDPTMDFTVSYSDATSGVLGSSFDSSDVTVSGPGGFNAAATFVSVNTGGNGSPRIVTYRINAPGGTWDLNDNGTYTVTQVANQVRDVAGNFRSAGTIGTFVVNLPFAYIDGGTLQVFYGPGSSNVVTFTTDGSSNVVATEGGSSLPFAPSTFGDLVVHGSANNETIVIATQLTKPLTFDGQTGSDTINITGAGSYTFASDAAAMTANLSVIVGAGGVATFTANQHLAGLFVNGTAAVGGAGTTIVTKSLGFGGSIDVGEGNLLVDYDANAASPIGSFDGSAYGGITGAVAAGRNGGSWNGTSGIRTSRGDALHSLAVAEAADALGLSGTETATFAGETVDATAVLVKYTYAGDATLNGTINVDDYGRIDFNVNLGTSGWFNGDFNYDGKIDVDDYGIIDFNVAIQGPPL